MGTGRWPQKVSLNVYLFVYRAILSKVELSRLERMAGTTRLELVTSAVTVDYQPLAHTESVGYTWVVGNRWTYRDTLARFCATICATRMTISACANLSHTPTPLFSHCTLASVSFEEPDVTFYRPLLYADLAELLNSSDPIS